MYLPYDAKRTVQRNKLVLEGKFGNAVLIALDVPKISDMASLVARGAVILIEWVEVGSSSETSTGQVA